MHVNLPLDRSQALPAKPASSPGAKAQPGAFGELLKAAQSDAGAVPPAPGAISGTGAAL